MNRLNASHKEIGSLQVSRSIGRELEHQAITAKHHHEAITAIISCLRLAHNESKPINREREIAFSEMLLELNDHRMAAIERLDKLRKICTEMYPPKPKRQRPKSRSAAKQEATGKGATTYKVGFI